MVIIPSITRVTVFARLVVSTSYRYLPAVKLDVVFESSFNATTPFAPSKIVQITLADALAE
jgi:hypothetical protein